MQSDPWCAVWRGGGISESFGVSQKKKKQSVHHSLE